MKERKKLKGFYHYNIWRATIFLCAIGAIMVYSASSYECALNTKYNFDSAYLLKKQLLFIGAGLGICVVMQFVHYRILFKYSKVIYVFGIMTIFLLLSRFGVKANGAIRWIRLFGIQFQVAEVVKLSVIIAESYMIQRFKKYLSRNKLVVYMWGLGGATAVLLKVISNDLSSSIVIICITFGMSFIYTDALKIHLVMSGIGGIIIISYVYSIASKMPTQEELNEMSFRVGRIAAWIDPDKYALNQGYQTLQSLYAIGRGGWFGQGLGKSLQKMSAIPEAQNDMIFSIICEELGIVGAFMLIFLFGYLLYFLMKIAVNAKDIFGSALVIGVFFHIAIQTIMNIAVNVNLLPNTGIALPFISYGGTAVLCQLIEIAIILSVARAECELPIIKIKKVQVF